MKISDKIKNLRTKNNLTQEELASKLHVSRQTVSKWEQEVTTPSLDTLKELALIFKVELIDLLDDSLLINKKVDKYYKPERIFFLLNLFIVIVTILFSIVLFRNMDELIPAHYDMLGNITRYGNKIEYFVIPGLSLLFLPFSLYFNFSLRKKDEYKKQAFINQICMFIIQLVILFFTIFLGFKYTTSIEGSIMAILSGMMFSVIIAIMIFTHPIINNKRNTIIGFRTNFTLSSDDAWIKVNRFASYFGTSGALIGYIVTLITFKDWNIYLVSLLIISLIPAIIYHEILRRIEKI